MVCPLLHHLSPFRQIGRAVVRTPIGVPQRVGQLVLHEIGTLAQHVIQDRSRHPPKPMAFHLRAALAFPQFVGSDRETSGIKVWLAPYGTWSVRVEPIWNLF